MNNYALQVELNKKKISAMRQELDAKSSAFADKRFLESLGPPSSIMGREREAKQLLELLHASKDNFIIPLVSVYGRSGAGKSIVVKFVCENLADSASYSYVNLRKARTIFGCANLILEQLDEKCVKSSEGINHAIDQIEKRIEETLVRDKKQHFILVLDEFDVIFSDTRGKPSDFVYKLLNIAENLRSKGYWFCIVVISNSCLSDFALDDRVKSRMDNCEVLFAPYPTKGIFCILNHRAKKAFVKKIDDKVLNLCADLSGSEHGDCRRALQLLRIAGEIAKGSNISEDHVKEAAKKLDGDKLDLILETATAHQRLLLAALAKLVLNSGKEMHSTRKIYQVYSSLPTDDNRKLSYRRVFDLLAELENTGIIIAKTHSNGRHGYHNHYQLSVHHGLVGWTIDRDWWTSELGIKERSDVWEGIRKEVFNPIKAMENRNKFAEVTRRYQERFKP